MCSFPPQIQLLEKILENDGGEGAAIILKKPIMGTFYNYWNITSSKLHQTKLH